MSDFSHVRFISAGAGSGKTYRLTEELERLLTEDGVPPAHVVATTFTVKAASELQDRVRQRLIAAGQLGLSEQIPQALIGTVHAVCEKLLQRFAFELGLSPVLKVLSLEDGARMFNQALDDVVALDEVREMNALARRLGIGAWQRDVRAVADKARENDLSARVLAEAAEDNAEQFVALCPQPDPAVTAEALARTIAQALVEIEGSGDTTKGTAKYVRQAEEARQQLEGDDCPWSVWMALSAGSQAKANKKADVYAAAVREMAGRYGAHPAFQADVTAYIRCVMDIAGRATERFAVLKRERGLIDFSDMERETLKAMDNPLVLERLGEEIDVLLVDEFQDTNPIQLAIFLKLATLAQRVIFVGDVKQAIYAFRSSDPKLVFATLEKMARRAAETDRLPFSWRSRPELVAFFNRIFSRAFAADMPDEDVTLEAKRTDVTGAPVALEWQLHGRAREARFQALAGALFNFFQQGHEVMDRESGAVRRLRWGDVAVLARTNDHVEHVARTLKLAGIPVKMSLRGLLATPEVVLARAALRRLSDQTDTIATAEILALAESKSPEDWLAERVSFLDLGGKPAAWGEDTSPILKRLAQLRGENAYRSPVEIVARVLNDLDVRRIVAAWGPDAVKAQQRQRNVDAFLDLAVQFEKHCEDQNHAATLTGFLFWLENPSSPELDLQPVVTSGDAVQVLTYHKSKGLEWPVVVALDLDMPGQINLWEPRVLSAGFDVDDPLKGRFLRYWPPIFGRRTQPLRETFETSEEGVACAADTLREQRRLAYVGLTRARDTLIVALGSSKPEGAWLDALLDGEDDLGIPVEVWNGPPGEIEKPEYRPNWYAARAVPEEKPPRALVSPSAAPPQPATIREIHELGERLPVNSEDMSRLGDALHQVIAAELVNPGMCDVAAVLAGYGVEGAVSVSDALEAASRLRSFLSARYPDASVHVEYPVSQVLGDGRVVRGFLDVALRTADGWVVIDHKSTPQSHADYPKLAEKYAGQLATYAHALGGVEVTTLLHLPVSGALLDVSVESLNER